MCDWIIEPIASTHARESFHCGEEPLDRYLRQSARQNSTHGYSKTYVAVHPDSPLVVGYYTIATGSIDFQALSAAMGRRLPTYPLPAAHLARLAVTLEEQGRGLGEMLLFDSLARIAQAAEDIGIFVVTVTAKHAAAANFYGKYGFAPLQPPDDDGRQHLYLPLAEVRPLLEDGLS